MDEMDQLIANLQSPSQRLIELSFGAEPPLRVQQHILENLSPYFIKALQDTFREGKTGALHFQEEEKDVWKELIYWIFCHTLSSSKDKKNIRLAVRCWIAGDKYGIGEFQDAVMLRLLERLDLTDCTGDEGFDVGVVFLVLENTTSKSPLRDMLVEWMAINMLEEGTESLMEFLTKFIETSGENVGESLVRLDGTGFFPAIMAKKALIDEQDDDSVWRWRDIQNVKVRWKQFFVGSTNRSMRLHV